MRDSQRSKVYSWESKNVRPLDKGVKLSMEEIEKLAADASLLFGFNAPSIEAKHHGSATAHWGSLVRLPGWARCKSVVLHEVAHCIADGIKKQVSIAEAAHGPLFVRVFFELVCYFFDGVRPADLRKTLTAAHVKIGPAGVAATLTRSERKQCRDMIAAQAKLAERRAEVRKLSDAINADERLLTTTRAFITDRVKTARKQAAEAATKARAAKAERARARWQQPHTQEAAATIEGSTL